MTRINNPMEIFKLLNGSNCRDCNEKTCLAFAVAVFKNRKPLSQCPHLSREIIDTYGGDTERPNTIDEDTEEALERHKRQIPETDLAEAAERLGAPYDGKKLTIKVLGKDFSVDNNGNLSSEIHINAWLGVPVLNYVMHGEGRPVSGEWVTFRDLSEGRQRFSIYRQRCEKPLKRIADTYTDLFRDMLEIFNGRRIETHIDSDVSVLLYPLPLFPIMICYWEPEDGIDSSLHIFYDKTADANLDMESIYTLTLGLVKMFEKLSEKHGFQFSANMNQN